MTKETDVVAAKPGKPSTSNKSTGDILLIAKNLRELATAAALARYGYAEPQVPQAQSSFQSEQLGDFRDQVVQVAGPEVDGKVMGST